MTIFNITDRVNNGEDSFTQFTENSFDAKKLSEELVAFSNAEGGALIIGVGNRG
ncbi:AlbA family DNA-binding domain-containing protein [Desulfobacter sp.]|uniref:AlbA family DNA-binding domain-containing protein n=1 Tax=Desulfobacter sp. TaxID=2294 RepID=UPI003D112E36